jgi:hypothetical protein
LSKNNSKNSVRNQSERFFLRPQKKKLPRPKLDKKMLYPIVCTFNEMEIKFGHLDGRYTSQESVDESGRMRIWTSSFLAVGKTNGVSTCWEFFNPDLAGVGRMFLVCSDELCFKIDGRYDILHKKMAMVEKERMWGAMKI